jgi:hypothetical protein
MKGPMPGSRRIELVREPHLRGHGLRLTVDFGLSAATYAKVAKAMAAGDHRAAREVLLAAMPGTEPYLDIFFAELIHFQAIDENPPEPDPAFQARVEGLLTELGVPTGAVR